MFGLKKDTANKSPIWTGAQTRLLGKKLTPRPTRRYGFGNSVRHGLSFVLRCADGVLGDDFLFR